MCLVHHRSYLLSRAFSAMKYLAMRLVHRRSLLLSRAVPAVSTRPRAWCIVVVSCLAERFSTVWVFEARGYFVTYP